MVDVVVAGAFDLFRWLRIDSLNLLLAFLDGAEGVALYRCEYLTSAVALFRALAELSLFMRMLPSRLNRLKTPELLGVPPGTLLFV